MIATEWVPAADMVAYVERRGYKASPIVNDAEQPARILGFRLTGPRGNRTIIMMERNGMVNLGAARLWCDGVEYATIAIATKRLRKERRL